MNHRQITPVIEGTGLESADFVIHLLILIVVLAGGAFYFMTPDERTRALRIGRARLHDAKDAITLQGEQCDAFLDALRTRTRLVIAAPSLIVVGAVATLAGWSGQFGPAHSQWTHLVTTIFVHERFFDLIVNSVCLLQAGLILERLVGRQAFTAIYVATGVAAGIVTLSAAPDVANIGSTGSVIGLYGLLLVTSIFTSVRHSPLAIPLNVATRVAPVAAVFVLYHFMFPGLATAAVITALAGGMIGGIVVARDIQDQTPPLRRVATAMTCVLAFVMAGALFAMHRPAAATTDVRPEIERMIAIEHRTAGIYDQAVDRFRKGRINAKALADVIQQAVVPELHAVTARITSLRDVQPDDQPLIATVEEFLRLRNESWKMRTAALLDGDILALRQADRKEQVSLEALHRVTVQSGTRR